jgi:hypothetical protein
VPFLCAVLAILAALSYPIYGFNAVTSISELFTSYYILFVFGMIPFRQLLVNDRHPSASKRIECKTLDAINGLNTFNSK